MTEERVELTTTNIPSTDARVMHWPARTCYPECGHADCDRRRREVRVPCSICGGRIRKGEMYRVLSKVSGEIVSQVHVTCSDSERWR